jgi:hypothetical protein
VNGVEHALQVFDRMAATGKLELPTELLITLSTLENVVTSPYLTAQCSPRGELPSPRGGGYMASPPSQPCSPALAQTQASSSSFAGNGSQHASSPGRSTSPNRVSCTDDLVIVQDSSAGDVWMCSERATSVQMGHGLCCFAAQQCRA